MILTLTDWLLLTTTALGVVGTGYGQWKLRQERQALPKVLYDKEQLAWHEAYCRVTEDIQRETGLTSLDEIIREYPRLVRVIGSIAGHLGREGEYANHYTLSPARLEAFGALGHIIRCLQINLKQSRDLTNGKPLYLANGRDGTEPAIAALLKGLSLQEVAALTVCLLAERSTVSSGIEETLVRMRLRPDKAVEASQ
jgi:hypothetical protein